jgi:serine/threonine protein kinase
MEETYIPHLIQNKYKIIDKIGKGSYSKVYKAIHLEKKYYVAIKFDYDAISKKLLENEIQIYLILLKYKIQNICNIKSFGIYNSYNYIVMELLPINLYEFFIENKKTRDMQHIKYIFLKTCNIIQSMHKIGIYHRDIKPENFMINNKYDVFSIDLGLSIYKGIIKKSNSLIGSPLLCSYNIHKKEYIYNEMDDIISIYYMFFYLLSDENLPWLNVCIDKKNIKNKVMYNLKKYTNFNLYYNKNELIQPFIASYYNYIKSKNINI